MDTRHLPFEDAKNHFIRQVRNHSFVTRCREGRVTLDELKVFLVQHGKYGTHFTRYLCALMSNLPGNKEILRLAANLFEELGFDTRDSTPHHEIYQNMMEGFGISIDSQPTFPETENLIVQMLTACRRSDPAYGLGAICLGAEAIVPALYSDLIAGFVACGIGRESLEFFQIHVSCDDAHAETLRDIMAALVKKDPGQEGVILDSGTALVKARMKFLNGVEAGAAMRSAIKPHR
jgi:pyrroloquinoline-quinone synthase